MEKKIGDVSFTDGWGLLNLPLDLPPQIAALCPVDALVGF